MGKYLTGHRNVGGYIALPIKLYPGINEQHSLVTKHFMRKPRYDRYLRHDLRVWESAVDKGPRLRNDAGNLMLGDDIMNDWRARTQRGRRGFVAITMSSRRVRVSVRSPARVAMLPVIPCPSCPGATPRSRATCAPGVKTRSRHSLSRWRARATVG